MSDIQIFVEGIADQKFLQDLIAEWYGVNLTQGGFVDKNQRIEPGDILNLGGKNCFEDAIKMRQLEPILRILRANGTPLVVIFDADDFSKEQAVLEALTQTHGFQFFLLPARKTKIYNYVEVLVGKSRKQKAKAKEENRDYRDPKHWNLDPTHPALQPLKAFLDPFFSTPQ